MKPQRKRWETGTGKITRAVFRKPGPDFGQGLTTADLGAPSFEKMTAQHQAYVGVFRSMGIQVIVLEPLPGFPDAYFVEDAAVMLPEAAVITRPGAPSREEEPASLESVLAFFKPVVKMRTPAALDGGDVLRIGRHFFIGLSNRTNRDGAAQLGKILESHGFTWTALPTGKGLHLKSDVSALSDDTLLVAPWMADGEAFSRFRKIVLDPDEVYAANSLAVNNTILIPEGFPKIREKLEGLGFVVDAVDVSEARKMDGGLSCMSLRF